MDDNRATFRKTAATVAICFLSAIALAATFYVCWRFAFSIMFSTLRDYDDEGWMLIALDEFSRGRPVYDVVVTNFGPMGFLPKLALVKLLGLTVNHDVGRIMTLGCWLFSSLMAGIAAWRLGRSVAWFGVGTLVTCLLCFRLADEPGHPQDICVVLLSLAAVVSTFRPARPRVVVSFILAGIGALLAMTKINLGVFYVAALGAALLCAIPTGQIPRRVWLGAATIVVAVPYLLIGSELQHVSAFSYATEISLALVACIIASAVVAQPAPVKLRPILAAMTISFVGTVLAVSAVTIALGTSASGLFRGVILMPLHIVEIFAVASPLNWWSLVAGILGLALAAAVTRWIRQDDGKDRTMTFCIGVVRLIGALLILKEIVIAHKGSAVGYGPAFAWLILLPTRPTTIAQDSRFSRLFLAFLAVLESLWGYGVWGTQADLSEFLMMIVATITLADGLADLAWLIPRPMPASAFRIAMPFAAWAAALCIGWSAAARAAQIYADSIPLGFPGCDLIRVDEQTFTEEHLLVDTLRANSDVFFTFPGRESLHYWALMPPPTDANLTEWMFVLDDQQQNAIVAVLAAHPRACVLFNHKLLDFWMRGRNPHHGPLYTYLIRNFRVGLKIDADNQLWVHNERTSVTEVYPDGIHLEIALPPP